MRPLFFLLALFLLVACNAKKALQEPTPYQQLLNAYYQSLQTGNFSNAGQIADTYLLDAGSDDLEARVLRAQINLMRLRAQPESTVLLRDVVNDLQVSELQLQSTTLNRVNAWTLPRLYTTMGDVLASESDYMIEKMMSGEAGGPRSADWPWVAYVTALAGEQYYFRAWNLSQPDTIDTPALRREQENARRGLHSVRLIQAKALDEWVSKCEEQLPAIRDSLVQDGLTLNQPVPTLPYQLGYEAYLSFDPDWHRTQSDIYAFLGSSGGINLSYKERAAMHYVLQKFLEAQLPTPEANAIASYIRFKKRHLNCSP